MRIYPFRTPRARRRVSSAALAYLLTVGWIALILAVVGLVAVSV